MRKHVVVQPYDEAWKTDFINIRDELNSVLEDIVLGIEHVGSTSVEGLSAKPVIDIDVVIEDRTYLPSVISALQKIGYTHEGDLGVPGREAFKYEGKELLRKHHLYVCDKDAKELKRHIAFRDYLRSNPDAASEYGRIKEEGARMFPWDIDKYIEHKSSFIETVYNRLGLEKIAMFTMGTRGDVQPYIYLSKGLMKNGYEVTLGSHPCWRGLIEAAGIEFAPVGPDIDIEKEASVIRGKTSNAMLSMIRCMNFIMKIIRDSSHEVYELCKGKDLIIVTHSMMGAVEAGVLGIPTVNVTLQTEMIAEKLKEKTFKDRLIGGMIAGQVAKPYNKIRKKYGLKPVKTADEIMSDKLNLIPVSKFVLDRNPYWEDKNVITGYWFDEEEEYTPDDNMLAFLNEGDKPVILSLGAMSFEDRADKAKLDMFVNAFRKTGCRAIIQGFQKTLADYELPDSMIACGSIPHSWLFRQGKFVIHHCGFGTAASTLICGIPSIPVPYVLDQLGFALQLEKAGVATKHIDAKDLTEETVIRAIEEMYNTYAEKKKNAVSISDNIRTENGVAEAVRLITGVMDNNIKDNERVNGNG